MLSIWVIAFLLDWHSTVIQHPGAEENPFVRFYWETYGDIGLAMVSIVAFIFTAICTLALYRVRPYLVWAGLPLAVFKILIALTNYAILPYWVLAWY